MRNFTDVYGKYGGGVKTPCQKDMDETDEYTYWHKSNSFLCCSVQNDEAKKQ